MRTRPAQPSSSLYVRLSIAISTRVRPFAPVLALLAVSGAVIAAYIANSPRLDRFGDSPTYEYIANALPQSFLSTNRVPGYPILIAVSSWLPGGREVGLMVTQGALILAAVVATYLIARAALGHDWMAFVVGLVLAGDLLIAGYVRVVMSETLAVFLTLAFVLATLRFMRDFKAVYAWLMAGLVVGLTLTRPEFAFVLVPVVPYLLYVAWRRGVLRRRMVAQAIGSVAAVFVALGAYCAGNLAAHGYFGLSSYSNVALLGKVKVYGMVDEAPAPYYSSLVPAVDSYDSPWELVLHPPFNDPNQVLAGQFARAVVFHDPVRFTLDVLDTAITSSGEHDAQFLNINPDGALGRPLRLLLTIDQTRYRAFVILPALAMGWLLAALAARRLSRAVEIMGALSLIVLYDWLITAAGTFAEFERLRMPTNAIGTIIVLGTILLTLRLAARDRSRFILAIGLVLLEVAAIGFLPRISPTGVTAIVLVALGATQAAAILAWSGSLAEADQAGPEPDGLRTAPSLAEPTRVA